MGCAVEIIGHRGASSEAPENTLASFKLGFQQHADAIELDVRLTADGKLIVVHDADTYRTTGVRLRVAQETFAGLRRLDAANWGKWKEGGFCEKLPSFEEVLALVPQGKRLFVEIKCGPEILSELERALGRAGRQAQPIALIGFGYETMQQAKARLPGLEVCWLVARKATRKGPPLEELARKAKAANLDGLDLESSFPLDRSFVAKVHGAGLKLYTWTVDDPELARKQAQAGVDGITTNRPGWLRAQLAGAPES